MLQSCSTVAVNVILDVEENRPTLPEIRMMEETNVLTDESYDSYDEQNDRPTERWAPLGAAATATPPPSGGEDR